MLWVDVELARKKVEDAKVYLRWAEQWLTAVRGELAKSEVEYLKSMGVEARYRSRHDPFDDVYDVYVDGEKRGVYTSIQEVLKAVREAELAGYL